MPIKNRLDELNVEMLENEKPSKKKKSKHKYENVLVEENAFEKYEVIRNWITAIEENTQKCQTIYQKNPNSKDLYKKLKDYFKNSETVSYNVASSLKKIKDNLNASNDKTSAEFRMKLIQYTGLVEQFKIAITEQEQWTQKIADAKKNFIQKCHQIVNHEDLEDAQLNQLINENPHIFTQDYIQVELEARRQLADLESRHEELLVIEEHLTEVRDLFIQIATLVELQQESLNRVEFFAAQATDHIDLAVEELDKAKKSKKRGLKIKIALVIGIILIVTLILISIFC